MKQDKIKKLEIIAEELFAVRAAILELGFEEKQMLDMFDAMYEHVQTIDEIIEQLN